ncbi:AAA family ATPase [Picosynechococcus sp. NKBG15041c]|uniref:AAA family ATPase n=1 Tax=Picosynechococcus sp. NKBG15041c TaxID=1407650 RepID=UPI0004222ED0|nr:AAA family ATPase [Picosynechococcus sp. NKBG15041c]
MDLFDHSAQQHRQTQAPLADRMRPRTLDEYVGQEHIIAPGRLLRRAIALDQISSLIFYGPPGTGKTTLARIIANTTESYFVSLNAVLAGIKDIREAIAKAQEQYKYFQKSTLLFIDEVHRFNKAQQDALLPWVENGTVILIGATTENPYFEVNKALVSRSRIFQLTSLESHHLEQVLAQTLGDKVRGYGEQKVIIVPEAKAHLIQVANGDARTLLNALELAVETTEPQPNGEILITLVIAEDSIQQRAVLYDKEGDAHFDTISAFIKSVRGSDPDAALYWLARMLYAGEEPRYIFRRLLILACEDIGLADPHAVTIVNACAETFDRIGMPEGRYPLAQATLYLATAPKSNSVMGFFDAIATVQKEQISDVPNHLKDPNRDKEEFGHGADYQYPHAYREHWVEQQYLPDFLQGKQFYDPSEQGYEKQIKERVLQRREAQIAAFSEGLNHHRLEVLTYGKTDAATERWLQRTLSETGQQLGEIRDRLFSDLTIQRHDVILDLNAGNGLLTWEALRRSPEGGVYSLVWSLDEENNLAAQAARLDEVQRPQIIRCEPTDVTDQLNRIAPEITFDKIIGRNVFMGATNKVAIATQLKLLLTAQTSLRLVEAIPCLGQRLYKLLELEELTPPLTKKLMAAEEAIYDNPDDAMVNWNATTLKTMFAKLDLVCELQQESQTTQIYISPQLIKRWFTPAKTRPAYIDHLSTHLTAPEIHQIQQLFERQLQNKQVNWHSTLLWITKN